MLLRVDSIAFKQSINSVIGIVKDKSLSEHINLTSLYMQCKDGELFMRGADISISFIDKIPCTRVDTFSEYSEEVFVLSSDTIGKLADNLAGGVLEIEVSGPQVSFRYGTITWDLNKVGIDAPEDIAELLTMAETHGKFDAQIFASALDSVSHIIDPNSSNEACKFLYIHDNHMFATNTKTVAFLEFGSPDTIILSLKACRCLSAVLDNLVGTIEFAVRNDEYLFITSAMVLTVGMAVLQPLKIQELIALKPEKYIKVPKAPLVQALNRCLVYDTRAEFKISEKALGIESRSQAKEVARDSVDIEDGFDGKFQLDASEFKYLISPCKDDIKISAPINSKILIKSANFTGVIALFQ